MNTIKKIAKKNNRHDLGIYNRELVIRFAKGDKKISSMYHLVLTRRRSQAGSRYDKLGYFEIEKNSRKRVGVLGLNRKKLRDAIEMGATFHISVYKILFN